MARQLLTTMEEDFKTLGLPLPEVTESKADKTETKSGDLDEVKQVRTKRHTASERRRWKMAKRKGKAKSAARKYRKKAGVKRMAKKHRLKAKAMRHGKAAGRKRMVFTGLDKISNLLENAQAILDEINDEDEVNTLAAGFVAVANVAESLVTALKKASDEYDLEEDEAEELTRLIKMYENLAGSARVSSKKEMSESLAETFRDQAGTLVEGLEIVSDLTEDEDFDAEDDLEDDEDEDLEEDDDEDLDDEDFDDEDEDLDEEFDDFDLDYDDEEDDEDLDECEDEEYDDEDDEDDEDFDEEDEDDEGN